MGYLKLYLLLYLKLESFNSLYGIPNDFFIIYHIEYLTFQFPLWDTSISFKFSIINFYNLSIPFMGYIPNAEIKINVEKLPFQFPLWDTYNLKRNSRKGSIFQFPLWDTKRKNIVYYVMKKPTFNSLYGIRFKSFQV